MAPPQWLRVLLRRAAIAAVAAVVARVLLRAAARLVAARHRGHASLRAAIAAAPATGLRVAVVGSGISGVQTMKALLEEGIEPVCFEADDDVCGFWRYKEDPSRPSVYRSTHIDTDRDINCYGDLPNADAPLLLHNSHIQEYLRRNIREYDLERRIRLRTRVDWATPSREGKGRDGGTRWDVTVKTRDEWTGEEQVRTDTFDGIVVCSGRHGRSGVVPRIPGLDTFEGQWLHSSLYKHPAAHGLEGKTVVVVGVGNSGMDLITELAPVARRAILVCRSGCWVIRAGPGEKFYRGRVNDRLTQELLGQLPWWENDDIFQNFFKMRESQAVLCRHDLEPKHKFMQQHLTLTGLGGQATLHSQLEAGKIEVRKGIERMTQTGCVFAGESAETPIDAIVFATGYKQCASFIDPEVCDMSYAREGNDVPLYKGCLPVSRAGHDRIAFINFVQTATFVSAELQSRFVARVFAGRVALPPAAAREREVELQRASMAAQYIDRPQYRNQHGIFLSWYEEIAEMIGCRPSLLRLLRERPTALWHGLLVEWRTSQYRLVGPGRLEPAEQWIEDQYASRHGAPGVARPANRGGLRWVLGAAELAGVLLLLLYARARGKLTSGLLQDKVEQNRAYLARLSGTGKVELRGAGAASGANAGIAFTGSVEGAQCLRKRDASKSA